MMKRRIGIGIAVLLGLAVGVPAIAVPGIKAGILQALQSGLGRRIEADAVHLRLLPLPGVELDNVRLADDPAFGAEDMAIADDAIASVSFRALLGGRLAFSRIRLDNASINLVRNGAGRWNVAALLNQTSRTEAGRPGRALPPSARFPYFELADSRVNFVLDQTKSRFYLGDVQASLRRDSDHWQLRLECQPLRTDLNLSNTGGVVVDGRWGLRPQAGFRELPFDLAVRLNDSYLAGSSALFAGHDAGMHGIVSARLRVQGTGASSFLVTGSAQAQSLRRWDLLPPPTTVRASISASYIPSQDRLLVAGIGDPGWSKVRLSGTVANVLSHPQADLKLEVRDLEAAALLPVAEAVKAHVPAGLQAAGRLDGSAEWRSGGGGSRGRFEVAGLALSAPGAGLSVPEAVLRWSGSALQVPPAAAAVSGSGRPEAVRVGAELDGSGFRMQVQGRALSRDAVAGLARLAGLRSPWPWGTTAPARVALALAAPWSHYRQVAWRGSIAAPLEGSELWRAIRPPGGNLLQRMLGAAGPTAVPEWLRGMRGEVTVALEAGDARGSFQMRRGADRLSGRIALQGDTASLDELLWREGDVTWRGAGTASLPGGHLAGYDVALAAGRRKLHLVQPAAAR